MADDFSADVAALAGELPIALLPVRIEARFFDDARELRVRIFPDQIHVDAHERELTAQEREAGMAYWTARIAGEADAWRELCAIAGPARAAWIVEALEPLNLDSPDPPQFPVVDVRPQAWSRAAVATALPERWLVVGSNDGEEIFRVWTKPVADDLDITVAPRDDTTALADGALPLQPAARWLVDFKEAERVGMAVRVSDLRLPRGLDRLYVLGVDSTLAPPDAAAELRDLFARHAFTDGLSMIEPGTPTNATGAGRPGAPASGDALVEALDPARRPPAAGFAGTGADRAWRALGLPLAPDDLLTAIPGAQGREQDVASHLTHAVWESTLGVYLADLLNPVISDAAAGRLREHVRRHLVPSGPLPALRVGRQPYGVLPVVAPGRLVADGEFEAALVDELKKLRTHWEVAIGDAPRLGRTGELDADLAALLQRTPMAATLRFRPVLGPLAVNATTGLEPHAAAQGQISELVGLHVGWPERPFILGCTARPAGHPLRVPLVDPVAVEPEVGLSRNYLAEIAQIARTAGSYEAVKAREDADTLLEALTAHAVARELHRADLNIIDLHLIDLGRAPAAAIRVNQTAELIGVEDTGARRDGTASVTTPFEAARLVLGQRSVREIVTAAIPGGSPAVAALGEVLESLEWLSTRTVAELDRGLRGLLDSYAYRLDAWFTSLATRRLARHRATTPEGLHLGGYGWLEDLRPDAGDRSSEGYVHAPSLPQAVTAAVLRSGRLAHQDAEHEALDIDLRSDRVRAALELLDAVATGQPLAALLGYRFERALRERGPRLARYILPVRRLCPLRTDASDQPAGPAEAIAARDVVDGVALLDRRRTHAADPFTGLEVAPPSDDASALRTELERLADLYDAVADLMIAEAVHQTVLGNTERAGAVLAALDRQGVPPRMDFPRTPRSGKSLTHRVLVLLGDEPAAAAWPVDPRANAEPRLNAWIGRVLGDPARVRLAATAGEAAAELGLSLSELGLSPLSLVLAGHAPGGDRASELDQRLLDAFAAQVGAPTPEAELVVLDAAPPGSGPEVIGLGALRALLRRLYELITGARSATAADLALPQDAPDPGLDDAELRARGDALVGTYGDVRGELAAASTAAELRAALWSAAALHVDGSVPPVAALGGADERDALAAQAAQVAATMQAALEADEPAAPAGASPRERVGYQIARVRALLGAEFPVLGPFLAPNAVELSASRAARADLLGKDPLAPSAWLQRMALVRTGVDRLASVIAAAELLRGDVGPDDLLLVQLPHADGDRWLGLRFGDDGEPPQAELAIVAATSGTVALNRPLAGLFCDAWTETIPDREAATGIAFHHDAPGSRPPQALLLAVPPAAENPAWSVDVLLDTVVEAHDLARIRAVGPGELDWLGTLLPALYLPESLSKDVPTVDLRGLVDKYAAAHEATILGKD